MWFAWLWHVCFFALLRFNLTSWCISHFSLQDRLPLVVFAFLTTVELWPCTKASDGHSGDAKTGLPNINYEAMFKVTVSTFSLVPVLWCTVIMMLGTLSARFIPFTVVTWRMTCWHVQFERHSCVYLINCDYMLLYMPCEIPCYKLAVTSMPMSPKTNTQVKVK